ncbi:MAG: flagellar regulator YcgR PilZN domain-containing protein [Pseudomonadota bacterium]
MAAGDRAADLSITGLISRSPQEIARVLAMIAARGDAVRSSLGGGGLTFESRLLHVDPALAFIVLALSADQAANRALLARPRASFHAEPSGWRIEFAAAEPQLAQHQGRAAVRLRFPEIVVSQQRRAQERVEVASRVALHFVADAGGIISFEGVMVDISPIGIGFLQYPPDITLEPGTILKGCRIEPPGRPALTVDMEVRYSTQITLPDGQRAKRSGCRFIEPGPGLMALLEEYFRK